MEISQITGKKKVYKKYKGNYVVYVMHPSMPNQTYNAKGRKRHFSKELEGKSLCNMLVQFGIEKFGWEDPFERITKPKKGAHEVCAVCYQKLNP